MRLDVTLPRLHPGQVEVRDSPARFKVLASGRRWGKTRLATTLCIATAVQGGRAWWVAPTFPIASIGWRLLKTLGRQVPGAEIREVERRIALPGRGVVQAKSADNPDSLRGEGLDLVVMDEAAFIKEEAWVSSLRPALSDREGAALFISTPRGRNWFYYLWNEGQEREDWASWRFPTAANPFISPDEIESARQLLPALIFAQEYEAAFTEHFGAMFKREWFEILESQPAGMYVRFWDLAASSEGDYSAGVKAGFSATHQLVVADVVRGRWSWPELRRVIAQTARADGADVRVGIEQAAFQLAAVQDVQSMPELANITIRGVPVQSAGPAIKALYGSLPSDKAAKAARATSWLARAV